MESNLATEELLAYSDLKSKIVSLLFEFTENYNNLYPRTAYMMVDALQACLNEASYQVSYVGE